MDSRQALRSAIQGTQKIVDAYVADLSDSDLLVRPLPETNHIAWQLGHLIASENMMIEAIRPKSMPPLPENFGKRHSKETAKSDDPKAFLKKAEYLDLMNKQRGGTLAALETMSDADLDQPAPEAMRQYLKSVGDVFSMQANHWMMHAGQWAIVRRKLGRPPLF